MPPRTLIMGVINVSPESFYKGSVPSNERALRRMARKMRDDGADLIDVGAMSTAPYLKTEISETEEARRLGWAVRAIRKEVNLPISADTARLAPAEAALRAGARVLNDVTGLLRDPRLALIAKRFDRVILMAHPSGLPSQRVFSPVSATKELLRGCVKRARAAGLSRSKIILDPGIGFFRTTRFSWWAWDLAVLKNLKSLSTLGPLLVGISRKSFLSHILGGRDANERLAASLGGAAAAVLGGAQIIRTHDVRETADAVRVVEAIRAGRHSGMS